MTPSRTNAAAAVAGAFSAATTDVWLRGRSPRTPFFAAILVGAALVYPLAAHKSPANGDALAREMWPVCGTLAVAVAAVALPDRTARAVVAAGWILHAVFDQVYAVPVGTRLPSWYPAFCAGYDIVMAVALRDK